MNVNFRWAAAIVAIAVGSLLQGCATAPASQGSSARASGSQSVNQAIVRADTKENFEAVVAAIHQQMQPGRRWQYIDASERNTIDGSFADMAKLYDKFGSVDKMDHDAKVRLLVDQSTVNAILTKKDGERLICKTELPVGSHLPVKTCQTYAQMQGQSRAAQEELRRLNSNSPQMRTSGGH